MTGYLPFSDIKDYIALGSTFFPNADWTNAFSRFDRMYKKWSKGIIVYKADRHILGYAALWPLTKKAFSLIENGELQDDDIDADCIAENPTRPHKYWILTAIAISPREKELRRTVITAILDSIKKQLNNYEPCEILAHASTPDGERFLLRTGFRKIHDKLNIYKWSYSHE